MMTPDQFAHIHARAFHGRGRAWSAEEFKALLDSPHVFAVGDAHSFACGRVVADEAELLTIATDPDRQRQGLGYASLMAFEKEAALRGATCFFLEVAAGNRIAIAFYRRAGYQQIALRSGYYTLPDGQREDGFILRKSSTS